jgi:hypothetical protein
MPLGRTKGDLIKRILLLSLRIKIVKRGGTRFQRQRLMDVDNALSSRCLVVKFVLIKLLWNKSSQVKYVLIKLLADKDSIYKLLVTLIIFIIFSSIVIHSCI